MKTEKEIADKTAAYVTCHGGLVEGDRGCGTQPLTEAEYLRQLSMPNRTWRCPSCGNSADYNDTESERVQGVNDEPAVTVAVVEQVAAPTANERERVLGAIAAAIDEPNPPGFVEKANSVLDAGKAERELLGYRVLMEAALFIDDLKVDHPELDEACIRRVAADQIVRAALLVVRSARRIEGTPFNPGRCAFVVFNVAEEVQKLTSMDDQAVALLAPGKPGDFRAWCESEGICTPRQPKEKVQS